VVRVRAVPRPGETVAAQSAATFAGGKGANQAAAAALCGARVRMLGRGGSDSRFIVDALRAAGVETRAIALDDACAGAATVMVADDGQNAIVIAPEANMRIGVREVERFLEGASQGDIALFQNECSCLHEGIAAAAARGLRVWLNAAPADARLGSLRFEKLAGLVVNETEAEAMTGERDPARALEALAARMPAGTVIVTLGAAGAIAAVGRARYAHRGFVVDAVDTVGCGDAFVGAFLAAVAEGADILRALACGNAAGALAAMREGAMPALPTKVEVDAAAIRAEGSRLVRSAPSGLGGKPARCEECGYELAANAVGDACPECGRVILPARFGGQWADLRMRRRFVAGSWLFTGGAAMLASGVGVILVVDLIDIFRWTRWMEFATLGLLLCSQMVLPLAMVLLVRAGSTRRRWAIGEIGALVRIGGLAVIAAAAAGWFSAPRPAITHACFVLIVVSDGLFVRELDRICAGSGVARVPRVRIAALAALVAISAGLWIAEYIRGGVPYLVFLCLAAVSCFVAVELVLLARRLRARERA
jgi:ribokinase